MTRNEAINLQMTYLKSVYPWADEWRRNRAALDVDSFVALGMLKLDMPKSYASMIEEAMSKVRSTDSAVDVSLAFEAVGLRIVEK